MDLSLFVSDARGEGPSTEKDRDVSSLLPWGREHQNLALKPSVALHRSQDPVLPNIHFQALRGAVAAFAGALALPALAWASGAPTAAPVAPAASASPAAAPLGTPLTETSHVATSSVEPDLGAPAAPVATTIPDESCLAETLCGVKKQLKWNNSAPWSSGYCRVIARKVLDASAQHGLPPALLVAVMINESDLNERAVNTSMKGDTVYAKDSGLMGIRCVLNAKGHCTNGAVKGMLWKTLMDPLRNIEIGAGELARWRDGGGIAKVEMRTREKDGSVAIKTKVVPCKHKTHAYWAHYNHGPRYIDKGRPRHYPHRVAVLYHALAEALKVDAPELRERVTIVDKGLRPRTPDRPVEPRYREICAHIRSASGSCSGVASLPPAEAAKN